MPQYIYRAKKGPSEIVNGEIEAISCDNAVNKLTEAGLFPISVAEKGQLRERAEGTNKQEIKHKHGSSKLGLVTVRTSDVDVFTRQLASLVRTNVPILSALSLISEQTENQALKDVVSNLERQVKDGKTLSEALNGYPNVFDKLYINVVKVGERGGVLDEVLHKLAEYRDKEAEARRKIQAAMAYPLFIIIMGAITVFAMLTFFLPNLLSVFEDTAQTLPLPTAILLGISGFMSGNWHWFLIAAVFMIAVFKRAKSGSKKKLLFDILKLHLPFFNKFIRNAEVAKFTRTLGMLIKNGIPIYEGLELATAALDNDVLKERLLLAEREIITQGSTLRESLKKIEVFPAFVINMIAVGEESGTLDNSLDEVSITYERELEQAMRIMISLLEPLLILIVGGIVGFIVFAMLLPIFNITTTLR